MEFGHKHIQKECIKDENDKKEHDQAVATISDDNDDVFKHKRVSKQKKAGGQKMGKRTV